MSGNMAATAVNRGLRLLLLKGNLFVVRIYEMNLVEKRKLV